MRKVLFLVLLTSLFARPGFCYKPEFKSYLEDKLRKYSGLQFTKRKIDEDDESLTYCILPKNYARKQGDLIAKIIVTKSSKNPLGGNAPDRTLQFEYGYYYHSVKDDYAYVMFLREKKLISGRKSEEDDASQAEHKILVVPLKGFLKDRGAIELTYYDPETKNHVVINGEYHILIQLKESDKIKVQFKGINYNF